MRSCLVVCVVLSLGSEWCTAQPQQELNRWRQELRSEEATARRRAAQMLGDLGPAAAPAVSDLVKALKDKDAFVRRNAARALGLIHRKPEESLPALAEAFKDEKREVVEAAAEAVTQFGSEGVKVLVAALRSEDPLVRQAAVRGLGGMGPAAAEAVPALIELFKREPAMNLRRRPSLRGEIAETLGNIGAAAKEALPVLRESLENNRDRDYRRVAQAAIRKIETRP